MEDSDSRGVDGIVFWEQLNQVKLLMIAPANIQLIGSEVAIAWSDGSESYYQSEMLRAASPSAANIGETDILGQTHGGDERTKFPGVTVQGWEIVGNYAVRFDFSDGHRTGLFSYSYLQDLSRKGE